MISSHEAACLLLLLSRLLGNLDFTTQILPPRLEQVPEQDRSRIAVGINKVGVDDELQVALADIFIHACGFGENRQGRGNLWVVGERWEVMTKWG